MTDGEPTPLGVPALPPRDPAGHKGTFGTASIIGGSAHRPSAHDGVHMVGGPCLAATAALRAGCGLARLALPEPILDAGLTIAPSATGFALPVDDAGGIIGHLAAEVIDALVAASSCIGIGPGLGTEVGAQAVTLRMVQQESVPVVVDADALNCLALVPELHRDFRAPAVLTPHPGEYARLAGALGLEHDPTDPADRPRAAEALAQRVGAVVVLKGAATVVTDGQRMWMDPSPPNPVLATAGSGDVLGGVIAGLIAQHYRPHVPLGSMTMPSERVGGMSLAELAVAGVAAHSAAAAAWRASSGSSGGMLASELTERVPAAVEGLRRG